MCPQLVPRGARILEGVDTSIKAMYVYMYVCYKFLVVLHCIQSLKLRIEKLESRLW